MAEKKEYKEIHQKLAHWMDNRFTVPGTNINFGLDPLLGLVPVAGDVVTGLISSYFILLGIQANVSYVVLVRMGFNILVDVLFGSIPLLGDLFDVGWKANKKNAELLEKYRRDAKGTIRKSKAVLWGTGATIFLLVALAIWFVGWVFVELIKAVF